MRIRRFMAVACWGCLAAPALFGCSNQNQEAAQFSILDPLGIGREIFGLGKKPVRVGITLVHAAQGTEAPWAPIQRQMQWSLGQPVQFESLRPFQIKAHLESGRLQFAMVQPEQVGEILEKAGVGRVIATPEFEEGANQARALLVVSSESEIESIDELRGKRIAFGPIGDAVTHIAALKMLAANGIAKDDIPRELLPIPGMLRHHLNSFETGRAVIYEKDLGISGGFVLEREYESWPDTGGSLLLLRNAKDQLRVLGKTEVVPGLPEGPVLAGANVDAELVEKVRVFLTEELPRNKGICAKLGLRGYRAVGDVEPGEASSGTLVSQGE